ncbi:ROK family protein [Streptomyces qinzhouensis]|uniref:ROK family protein n=1 Tax=Streptomyces qinzhouensis TaxID=2599401 RepID=A0A5B8JQE0_9ACTN|nr:ROK family protein [Streptomyces qinzhouensis]QDY80120.1 ROK family protein [Streptomyces qinzhouensis]
MPRTEPTALTLLRRTHEAQVVDVLRRLGAVSRGELARHTGLSRTALSSITGALIGRAVVVAGPAPAEGVRGRGRPVELLRLHPATGRCAGVDLGRGRVRAVVANAAHQIVASGARACPPEVPWERRTDAALELLDELLDGSAAGLEGIGVGLVGPVPAPGERAATVVRLLGERYGAPVLVENNTRLAALAEAVHGAGAGARHAVYVHLSHGVGGGLVVDGRLLGGASGTAGEVGHMTADPGGPRCRCGNHGCLELYASLPAVEAAGGPGDDGAVARAGRMTGRVLAGLCTAVNPELLIVGGELAALGARLLGPLESELRARTLPAALRGLRIVTARLGDEGGALGAIALIRQEAPPAVNGGARAAAGPLAGCTGPGSSG